MTVYIEYAIADNLFADYILLRAAGRTVGRREKRWRLWAASAVGTAIALVLPVLSLPALALAPLKLLVAALMVWLAGESRSARAYFSAYAFFLVYTFAAGGCLLGLLSVWRGGAALFSVVPAWAAVFALYGIGAVCLRLGRDWKRRRSAAAFRVRCVVECGGRKIDAEGLIDSGNRLSDARTGKSVAVASGALAAKLFADRLGGATKARFLEFSTLAGKGRMMIFEIDRLWIYRGEIPNIITNVTVGISPRHFRGGEAYDLILPPGLEREENHA